MSKKPKLPKEKKKTKEEIWTESLKSGQEKVISDVLKIIREEGNINILPTLIEVYSQYKNTNLGKEIFSVILDIKTSNSVDIIMQYIANEKFKNIRSDLLSIGWQSRLDFTPYFERLIDIFLNCTDVQQALEIFTTIENFEHKISENRLKSQIKKLKANIDKVHDFQRNLLVELVHILENKIQNQEEY